MISNDIVGKVRSIASKMREIVESFTLGVNEADTAEQINRLADEAIGISDYHDYIFEKCNVIRSLASSFKSVKDHRKEQDQILDTISKLENWQPQNP